MRDGAIGYTGDTLDDFFDHLHALDHLRWPHTDEHREGGGDAAGGEAETAPERQTLP